jgi:hypothetical protein
MSLRTEWDYDFGEQLQIQRGFQNPPSLFHTRR